MSGRRALAALGLGLSGLGLATVLGAELLDGVPVHEVLVATVGVVVIALGVRGLARHRRREVTYADLPDVEVRAVATVPGVEFDRALDARLPDVRDRLRDLVIRVLMSRTGCTEATARDRLEEGDWTEDPTAAAFFSPTVADESDRTVGERVRAAVGVDSSGVVQEVERVVTAVATVASVDVPDRFAKYAGGDWSHRSDSRAVRADGAVARDDGASLPAPGESVVHETGRWRGVGSLALVAVGVGALVRAPVLLLVAAAGGALTTYEAYARSGSPPAATVSVHREVSDLAPDDGDEVTVTVTVTNDGDERLPDVRYVDGVPPGLAVKNGTPRAAGTVTPGEELTCRYTVCAEYGRHEFDPGVVVVRGTSGATERTAVVEGSGPTITCRLPADLTAGPSVALRGQTTDQFGSVPTTAGGEGLEFFDAREYRTGDPLSRVDWSRYARTGELSTIRFREERTVSVVLVVDARAAAYLAPDPTGRSAVSRSVEAAVTALDGLLDDRHRVGLTAVTPRETPWLPPRSGRDHGLRLREVLVTHPALSPDPPGELFVGSIGERAIRRRLPADAQAVLFTPLCDEYPAILARRLEARGTPTTVVSPDPTSTTTPGQTIAKVERAIRISDLRSTGVPVYDWARGMSPARLFARDPTGGGTRA